MFIPVIYKRVRSLCFLLWLGLGASAQTFETAQSLDFLGIQNPDARIVDLNNDGKLDAFIRGEDISGQIQYLILGRTIGTDSAQSEVFNVFPTNVTMGSDGAFTFSDVNNDNWMDLIISGKDANGVMKNEIHPGSSEYNFQSPITLPAFEAENIAVADLNNDGQKEIVWLGLDVAGNAALQILSTVDGVSYQAENLSLPALSQGALVLFDFDKNNYVDLLYQGLDATGNPSTVYLNNAKDFDFTETPSGITGLKDGNIKVADYDADGLADVLVHGLNAQDEPAAQVYLNKGSDFELAALNLTGIGKGQSQFADLNHDGLVDISLQGANATDDLINLTYIQNSTGAVELVPDLIPNGIGLSQLFGDFYFDGNLDVLQWKLVDGKWVFDFLQNTGLEANEGPSSPTERFAIQTFGDVKLFWSGAFDDKTPDLSLSHDIYIGTASVTSNTVSPSFNIDGRRRVLVGHGNQSLNSELNIFDLDPDVYYYGIQAIDNSFHATSADTGGVSTFFEDVFVVCDDLNTENISLCLGGEITLSNGGNVNAWYSSTQGLLGLGIGLSYTPTGVDTIYFSTPGSVNCADQGAIIVEITTPSALVPLQDFSGCESSFNALEYLGVADSLLWTVMSSGQTSNDNPAQISPDLTDQIYLEVYQCGLTFYDTMAVELFPTIAIAVSPGITEIFLGDSVQLNASGFTNYSWTPSGTLNQDDISNPIAKPNQTTTYEVVGTDANGCDAMGTVTIIVYDYQSLPDLNPCPGETVNIFFPGTYDSLEWTLQGSGDTSTANPLIFTPTTTTEVYLKVAVGNLTWFDTVLVSPQLFDITVAADTLEIFAGDSVQLEAFGAMNYNWSPAEGLSATNIANPFAKPDQTTLYTVTGENSLLCQDSATVLVIVYNFENLSDEIICQGLQLALFFPDAYDELIWTVDGSNISSEENAFTFIPTVDDSIFLEVFIGSLIWKDTLLLTVIDEEVSVAEDTLTIFSGESVQLQASGADDYLWFPANTLDRSTIANPFATPTTTTLYQVTGIINGCSDNASVLVVVNAREDIFIPTLFTPNNDSRNETFKIYGAALPLTLNFEIFNRSGQRVFVAENIEEIASRGWDGTHNGESQPPGVYYWKASGVNPDGSAFSYEGKNKGAIHLIR